MSGYAIANGIGFNSLGFSPKSISNLQLWHDATDIGTQGYSLDFDGTIDEARADNEIIEYPFTLETWVKSDTAGSTQSFFGIVQSGVNSRYYNLGMVSGTFVLKARNTTQIITTGTTTVVDGTWYHVAGVFASATDRKLYVDGILEGSGTDSVLFSNLTDKVLLGVQRITSPDLYLNGKLSDVRVWNTERTSAEILDNYNKRLIGNETGLVGYWKLSEGISAVAKDFTSNANDATITDAVWIVDEPFSNGIISDFTSVRIWKDKSINGYHAEQATSANRPTYRSNQIDSKATIQFDGTDDFLSLPSGALGILRNVAGATIFLVAKHSTDLTVQTGVWFTNGTAAGQVRILLRKSASNFFNISGRRLDADTAESVTSTTTNVGNYILQSAKIDYQNTLLEQFLNNTLDGQDLIYLTSGNTSDTDSLNASLGATNIGSYLNGNIAEVLIYNRTLSTAEFTNVNKYLMAKWGL
jgi:hypothetical protein